MLVIDVRLARASHPPLPAAVLAKQGIGVCGRKGPTPWKLPASVHRFCGEVIPLGQEGERSSALVRAGSVLGGTGCCGFE